MRFVITCNSVKHEETCDCARRRVRTDFKIVQRLYVITVDKTFQRSQSKIAWIQIWKSCSSNQMKMTAEDSVIGKGNTYVIGHTLKIND